MFLATDISENTVYKTYSMNTVAPRLVAPVDACMLLKLRYEPAGSASSALLIMTGRSSAGLSRGSTAAGSTDASPKE